MAPVRFRVSLYKPPPRGAVTCFRWRSARLCAPIGREETSVSRSSTPRPPSVPRSVHVVLDQLLSENNGGCVALRFTVFSFLNARLSLQASVPGSAGLRGVMQPCFVPHNADYLQGTAPNVFERCATISIWILCIDNLRAGNKLQDLSNDYKVAWKAVFFITADLRDIKWSLSLSIGVKVHSKSINCWVNFFFYYSLNIIKFIN